MVAKSTFRGKEVYYDTEKEIWRYVRGNLPIRPVDEQEIIKRVETVLKKNYINEWDENNETLRFRMVGQIELSDIQTFHESLGLHHEDIFFFDGDLFVRLRKPVKCSCCGNVRMVPVLDANSIEGNCYMCDVCALSRWGFKEFHQCVMEVNNSV